MKARKSYIVKVDKDLGERTNAVACRKGIPYQVFCRMAIARAVNESGRKHKAKSPFA